MIHHFLKNKPGVANYLCNWARRLDVIYIETPKVACTTIKRTLQLAEVQGDTNLVPKNVHDRDASPLARPSVDETAFLEKLRDKSALKFCFVRNPYTRILSCYLDKMVSNSWERNRLAPKLGFNNGEVPSFPDFLETVAAQAEGERDIHWSTQTYLLRPNIVNYSFIGRFEIFASDFGKLADHLGISEYADMKSKPHATNASDNLKSHYSEKEAELVQAIYEADFRNFGYGRDIDLI